MNNLFGFITLDDELLLPTDREKSPTIYSKKHGNYHLSLSYNEKRSHLIESDEVLLLFSGKLNNQNALAHTLLLDLDFSMESIIEKSYDKWGVHFLEKLEGEFTMVIYDKESQSLTLAKDKVGVAPLNYFWSDRVLIFGNRLSDFPQAPHFKAEISTKGLALYLQYGHVGQPHSIFKECYKVKSGHFNRFSLKERVNQSQSYWRLEEYYQEEKMAKDEREILADVHGLVEESIEVEHKSNIAISLSGGYDSSTIAGVLQSQSATQIDTITIGFEDSEIDEAPDAHAIAKHLKTHHNECYFRAKDALDIIPRLASIYDEPFAEYAAAPTIMTTEILKSKGIEHLFVGDAGDEVFATADNVEMFQIIQSIPHKLRETLLSPLKMVRFETIEYLKRSNNFPTKYQKLLGILSASSIPEMIKVKNTLFREDELKSLIKDYSPPLLTPFDDINFNGYHESVDEIIGSYFKTTMTDGELVKSYTACNHSNLSLNLPFLNQQLIEYMARVPSSVKIKDGTKKYILKEIAYHYIPKNLLDRPKSGFDIPFSKWMRGELKELLYEQINEKRLNQDNIFYTSEIINIRESFYSGHESYKFKLWRIFIFQLWYQNFKG